jgi:hypothetical protein
MEKAKFDATAFRAAHLSKNVFGEQRLIATVVGFHLFKVDIPKVLAVGFVTRCTEAIAVFDVFCDRDNSNH